MAQDYFTILGLSPGRYDTDVIVRQFLARRDTLLSRLRRSDDSPLVRRALDELHLAYATLRDPEQQQAYLRSRAGETDQAAELRQMIAAALEDGLLRYSRRQAILERARELGISEFQAQLMIAQVQFGDDVFPLPHANGSPPRRTVASSPLRRWPQVAATGLLAAAVFMYLMHIVGV